MRRFFSLGVCLMLLLIGLESMAQPPEGFRRGGRSRPPGMGGGPPQRRLQTPEAIIGIPDPPRPPGADTTLGIGTVPALWELKQPWTGNDELPSLSESDTIAPPVPAKVVRYAIHLLAQYDANGDGILQREEWANLPGSPQAIDIDGDGNIGMDELVRYLAVYGANRTIHRPNPVETFYQPRVVSSQFQLFRPLTAPPVSVSPTPTAEGTEAPVAADMLEEHLEDTTYEDIVADLWAPATKRYYTSPEALRGVPRWFLTLDRDGDGQVSLAEFAPNMSPASLALFGRLDKNGDGFITPDEVRKGEPPKKDEPLNTEVMERPALMTEPQTAESAPVESVPTEPAPAETPE